MSDRFDQVMQQYLLPMEKLSYGPVDSTYFLHKKGGLVYCEGYAHPPDGFYGALINTRTRRGISTSSAGNSTGRTVATKTGSWSSSPATSRSDG